MRSIFSSAAQRSRSFFNAHLAEPKILPKFEDEEYEDFSFLLRLEYFGKALKQEGEFRCSFLDEDGEEMGEPNRAQSDALEFNERLS